MPIHPSVAWRVAIVVAPGEEQIKKDFEECGPIAKCGSKTHHCCCDITDVMWKNHHCCEDPSRCGALSIRCSFVLPKNDEGKPRGAFRIVSNDMWNKVFRAFRGQRTWFFLSLRSKKQKIWGIAFVTYESQEGGHLTWWGTAWPPWPWRPWRGRFRVSSGVDAALKYAGDEYGGRTLKVGEIMAFHGISWHFMAFLVITLGQHQTDPMVNTMVNTIKQSLVTICYYTTI